MTFYARLCNCGQPAEQTHCCDIPPVKVFSQPIVFTAGVIIHVDQAPAYPIQPAQ